MEQRYIVGDWVNYMGVNPSRYAWVDAVEGTDVSLESDKDLYDANCFEIEPIPLTVEVLTYNGWKWSDEHEEFAKHGVAIYPVGNYYRTDIFNMKIRYVHQLQHLLFGLGLDNYMKMPKNYILPKGGEE